ncbi:hypothetical protein [Pelagicoccus sp. SDUM812003]|uniref:hypothetical protein n=1 Tax=Pelagicoccus sp. SDUM812003 TaxID=3041267 RepID=UPI002810603B|nr:hypothetical protein [Pelagicoccus sp. SDUM812003]MDQ8205717.1 hypothetical protein [Pelagicoccus sp. SDUM812003]
MNDLITKEEIEQFRTPQEFIAWFERFLHKTFVDRKYKKEILLRKGIAKEVYEEVFPVYRLLQIFGDNWDSLKFRNLVGDQNYDVEVEGDDSEPFKYIEITAADMNYEENLRMEYFLKHGSVSSIGRVSVTGTKRTGQEIVVESEARHSTEIVVDKIKGMVSSVEKKVEKDYPDRTALLVYIDDYVGFSDDEDLDLIDSALSDLRVSCETTFDAVFVVGHSGRRAWRMNRGEQVSRYNSDQSLRD